MRATLTSLTLAFILTMLFLTLGSVSQSQAQLTLYDDFNGKFIDPDRWAGSEGNAGFLAPNTMAVRRLSGHMLKLDTTTWGLTNSNSGTIAAQGSRLNITNPTPITTLQADVTVQAVTVVGCAANPAPSFALAQIEGGYFNDGTSSGAGDRTGDIISVLQKTRDSSFGDRIEAVILRCTNATCALQDILTFQFFGISWSKGAADTLRLHWDQANHLFTYTVNPDGPTPATVTLVPPVSNVSPPVVTFRQLSVGNKPASCMGPAPRTMTRMNALFDNVMVNP